MKDITLFEITEAKKVAEAKIRHAIVEFMNTTGLGVDGIDCHTTWLLDNRIQFGFKGLIIKL